MQTVYCMQSKSIHSYSNGEKCLQNFHEEEAESMILNDKPSSRTEDNLGSKKLAGWHRNNHGDPKEKHSAVFINYHY